MKYRTIVADPPWPIADPRGRPLIYGSGGRRRRSTRLPYALMSVADIAALPVSDLAHEDAHLFLWATRKVFREGQAAMVARAWGFEPCGEIIWGLRNPGFGQVLGNDHEPVMIARRGAAKWSDGAPRLVGVHFWRQTYADGGRGKAHSAKPEAFQDLIESVCPGPYVELFARRHRFNWDVWGNESANTARLDVAS